MSFSGPLFDYSYFIQNEYRDPNLWNPRYQSRSMAVPRTVAPTEVLQQANVYSSNRAYSAEHRYSSSSRNPYASHLTFPGSPSPSVQGPAQEIDDYDLEPQYEEEAPVVIRVHTQPQPTRFYCEYEGCIDPDTGVQRSVSRKADLRRHVESVHAKPTIDCAYKRCPRRGSAGFCRDDHYREHLRGYHNQSLPKQEKRRNS